MTVIREHTPENQFPSLYGDAPEPPRPARRRATMVWGLIVTALIIASLWLAVRFYDIIGLAPALVMGAVAAIGAILLIWMLPKNKNGEVSAAFEANGSGLSEAFEHSPNAGLITYDGNPVRANKAYMALAESLGVVSVSGAAPSIDQLLHSADNSANSGLFQLHHLPEGTRHAEETIDCAGPDGKLRSFRVTITLLDNGQYWQVKDISGDALHMGGLLSDVPIGLFTMAQDGQIIATNPNLDRWIGVEDGDKPEHIKNFIDNPDLLLGSPKTSGRVVKADTRLITRKGVVTPTVMVAAWREIAPDMFAANVALHGHSSLGGSLRHRSKTRAEPAAKADANTGASLNAGPMGSGEFTSAPFAIIELDQTNLKSARIYRANAAFERMSGLRDWQDYQFSDIFIPSESGYEFLAQDALACSPEVPHEAVLIGPDKLSVNIYIVADAAEQMCRVYLVDVSVRKSLEDQLVQSQKMQAVGRLVAEIAHDFNNLLAAMRLYTDTLLGRHPIGDPSYPELQQINSNVNRAASLVKKLLAYSRKQTLRAVKCDVTETLSDISVTLKQVLGERVNLDVVHGRDLPPIKVDTNQLDTVLMNLTVNARDAMKGQGGGRITITSRKLSKSNVSSGGLRSALDNIAAAEFVVISVTDTGTGITDEIKSKIFDPFFTTKPSGEGTGLGLSTVYGIVQQSGGHLSVESELGVGTTFSIYLPAYDGTEEHTPETAPLPTKKAVRRPADLAGQGNILFVEDEDSVRIIAAKTLRKRGYKVIEACDGEEAYEILEETETPFDLMISDVVMPGMDGPTLLKKGRALLGDARIVFISGYAEEEFSDLLSEEPDVTFLPKPFSLIELAEKVKSEIGEVAS